MLHSGQWFMRQWLQHYGVVVIVPNSSFNSVDNLEKRSSLKYVLISSIIRMLDVYEVILVFFIRTPVSYLFCVLNRISS